MTLTIPSDTESNVSGFMLYSDKNFKLMYEAVLENMEIINQDLQDVQKDLKYLLGRVGPLESQLNAYLEKLPNPNMNATIQNVNATMETE